VQQYNLEIQYEVAHNWIAQVGYVGSHGIHLYDWGRNINIDYLVAGAPNTPAGLAHEIPSSALPFNDPNNPTANWQTTNTTNNTLLRVPYLGFDPVGVPPTVTDGDALYNSLQAVLRHQFSHGLMIQAAYTWSKSITNVNASEAGGGIAAPGNVLSGSLNSNNPLDSRQQYGPAAFNRPQRFVMSYTYDLPWKQKKGLSDKLLGGWTISGVTTVQDGQPITITDGNGGTIYGYVAGSSDSRALLAQPVNCNAQGNCNSNVPLTSPGSVESRLNNYFNTAAFAQFSALPASSPLCVGGTLNSGGSSSAPCGSAGSTFPGAGTLFGNSKVGAVLGPGQFNWDIALAKITPITEGTHLEFRAEFYNVFNHAQFNPPVNAVTATNFGQITSTSVAPRIIQFGLKFLF
jgi:hypothetical protein